MLVFVFPGQGSQFTGMARDLALARPIARDTFDEADATLGFSLSALCFDGPEDLLQLTANAQPAILTASIAAMRCLGEIGIQPEAVAGHSLGEYSALVAARVIEFADAVRLVRQRGLYMQEAVPVGRGAMAAVMGLPASTIESICREASAWPDGRPDDGVWPANLNAPGQIVISGESAAVDRAIELAKSNGARRAVRLAVSAPFHCPLMQPAADRLAKDLEGVIFKEPSIPVVVNVDASVVRSGASAREALKRQVTAPVRWEESVRALAALGGRRALEVGPGRVLSGLIKRITPELVCDPAGDAAAIAGIGEVGP